MGPEQSVMDFGHWTLARRDETRNLARHDSPLACPGLSYSVQSTVLAWHGMPLADGDFKIAEACGGSTPAGGPMEMGRCNLRILRARADGQCSIRMLVMGGWMMCSGRLGKKMLLLRLYFFPFPPGAAIAAEKTGSCFWSRGAQFAHLVPAV